MKLRGLMLCGAAAALLCAGPAFAQQSIYDTNPTPAERAQTEQLNSEAADRARSDVDANQSANDSYNAARSDYDAEHAQYDRDKARYDAQHAAYDADRARYDDEHGHRWDAFYGHDRFRDVGRMPSDELIGMAVDTRGGSSVGRIRDVDTDHDGRVTRVAVRVDEGRTAWVDADDLRFDPGSRVVMTDLGRDQVNSMANVHAPRF